MKKQKGYLLIEVLIAMSITMFLLFGALYVVGSILSGSALSEKRVELVDELDTRINNFVLSNSFNSDSLGDMTFNQGISSGGILTFVGENSNYNITVVKNSFAIVT